MTSTRAKPPPLRRLAGHMAALTLLLVALPLVSCGGGQSSSSGSSSPGSSVAGGVGNKGGTATATSSGSCPLSQEQVDAAFGTEVPNYQPFTPTEGLICSFNGLGEEARTNAAVSIEEPSVFVLKFPAKGQPSTPTALRRKLEGLASQMNGTEREEFGGEFFEEAQWSPGAFMNITTSGPNEFAHTRMSTADIYFPHLYIRTYMPGTPDEMRAVALRLGTSVVEAGGPSESEPTAPNQTGAPGSVPRPCAIFTPDLVQTLFPAPIVELSDAEGCQYTNSEETHLAPQELATIGFSISKMSPLLNKTISTWEAEEAEPAPGHESYVEQVLDLGDSAVCHYDHYKTVHQTTAMVRRGDIVFLIQLEAFHNDGGCSALFELAREVNERLP